MSTLLIVMTLLFIVASVALVLIILVQRPQGGGLAGAFGGAGGGGTDTAFGGRTGDVLTVATVGAFIVYLLLGVGLNIIDNVDLGGDKADEVQAAAENDGKILEQNTPGEFVVPETAPDISVTTDESGKNSLNIKLGQPSSKTNGASTVEIKPTPTVPAESGASGAETSPGG